jgi:hypothetical protein
VIFTYAYDLREEGGGREGGREGEGGSESARDRE